VYQTFVIDTCLQKITITLHIVIYVPTPLNTFVRHYIFIVIHRMFGILQIHSTC